MYSIQLQMIDGTISSDWWKKLMAHFVRIHDEFEIRCWKEEEAEIRQAASYGTLHEEHNEVSIQGTVGCALLNELLYAPEPADKDLYNKMTKYFTVNIHNDLCDLSSAHYGTELYISHVSSEDLKFFKNTLLPCWDSFSIGIDDSDLE